MFAKVFVLFLLSTVVVSRSEHDVNFGACLPGKESCADCYLTLKKALLWRDDNILNLSRAFFPPKENIPVFVTVTYIFENSDLNSSVWYWTADSSYLFFQFTTFQYLSLFFGKPASMFSQEVTLTLNESCSGNKNFDLLTQRLKNFIEKKHFNPEIDENYFARSESDKEEYISSATAIYLLVCYVVSFVLVLVLVLILLWICYISRRWDKKLKNVSVVEDVNTYTQAKIFSAAGTTYILSLCILGLDSAAIYTLRYTKPIIKDEDLDERYVPLVVLGCDILLIAASTLLLIFALVACKVNHKSFKEKEYSFLAMCSSFSFMTFLTHCPYIAMAYLNDASHATSTFIYYTIIAIVLFCVLDLSYHATQGALVQAKKMNEQRLRVRAEPGNDAELGVRVEPRDGDETYQCLCGCPDKKKNILILSGCGSTGFTFLVLLFIGMITAALTVVPISKAISDAPNRLLGFYQTCAIIIGAYILYTTFLKEKPTLEVAIKKRMEHVEPGGDHGAWKRMSKDAKIEKFYSRFIDIVAKFDIRGLRNDGPPNDGPPNVGPPNDGPPNDGPPNDGPPNDGPPNDGPPNDGPPNDGPPNDGPVRRRSGGDVTKSSNSGSRSGGGSSGAKRSSSSPVHEKTPLLGKDHKSA